LVKADSDFYQTQENGATDTNWRDPWVFFDSRDDLWHMLITSDVLGGSKTSQGVVGHATSKDLQIWEVHPPLHGKSGFGQLEVMQVEEINGRYVGVFCVASIHLDQSDPKLKSFKTGTYSVPADSPTGPFHFNRADLIDADGIYAGRIIKNRAGDWVLLGFENGQVKSDFMGRICDPIPLMLTEAGTLKVEA
jgi:beta-fructofuranosidase